MAARIVNVLREALERYSAQRAASLYFGFMVIHMTVLALSGLSYRTIVKISSETEIARPIRDVMRRIVVLVERWNYEFAHACKVVSRVVFNPVREFLSRLVSAIDIGLEPQDFFKIEYENAVARESDLHERRVERLRKVCDAYSAVLSATTFVFAVVALICLFYGSQAEMILPLVVTSCLLPSFLLVVIAYRAGFRFPLVITYYRPPKVTILERAHVVMFLLCCALMALSSCQRAVHPVVLTLLPSGLLSLAVGLVGIRIVRHVRKVDEMLPIFIQALSDSMQAVPSLEKSLSLLRAHDYGALNGPISNMYARSRLRVDTSTLFKLFSVETLSELCRVSMEIFRSCLTSGASLKELGRLLTSYLNGHLTYRKRYDQVGSYLVGLVVPLHATQAAVISLILTLVEIFNVMIGLTKSVGGLGFLSPVNIEHLNVLTTVLLTSAVLCSALCIYSVKGGSSVMLLYYFGLIAVIASLTFYVTSVLALNVLGGLLRPLERYIRAGMPIGV